MTEAGWSRHDRVIALRRRSKFANTLVVALENFRTNRTGRNAALVAHYGFLSVFPLFLVFTTILGYVLQDRPRLQEKIIDSAFSRIPIIGQQIANEPAQLQGSLLLLVFGLLAALWAAMRAFNVLQSALDDVAHVAADERPNHLRTRLRSLLAIGVIGGTQIMVAVLTSFVGISGVRVLHKVLLSLGAVCFNIAVVAASYRWLCARKLTWNQVAPGAVVVGIVFAGLQLAGTAVVGRAIANASPVYGTFASVIGLITWLGLHSVIALLGAELNHVLPARRYDG
ncbi:MAG: YihY/virulence factor BrkB family protein [Actinobacteria bacterium]|nr:YihY/virulence factor BrkB family protein [Actinomycetota bacterium]